MINVNLNKVSNKGDLALANVEASAQGEIGPILTNWKKMEFECTRTVGFDYILVYTTSTTYMKDGCGYGSGWCLAPAGC